MRTQAFALVAAAAALASSLVYGAPHPAPTPGGYNSQVFAVSKSNSTTDDAPPTRLHPHIGIKEIREAAPDHAPTMYTGSKIGPRELLKRALDAFTAGGNAYSGSTDDVSGGSVINSRRAEFAKRTDDEGTLGGNAYTGNSGDVNGGDIVNQGNNQGTPTLLNINSNNAGKGGGSTSGCANGGHGNVRGAGGNGYSGTSGDAQGGSVYNSGAITNIDSNNAGDAGQSTTGCAYGGDVSDTPGA